MRAKVCRHITRRSFVASGLALFAGSGNAQPPVRESPEDEKIAVRSAEYTAAIDNICAWPCLVRLPEGGIAAIVHNQPSHGLMEGDVECHVSRDDGRTWRYTGTSSPHDRDSVRMNHAAGIARDGALVVLCSGWGGEGFRKFLLPVMVSRSHDGGATWDRTGLVKTPPGMPPLIPYGNIVRPGPDVLTASFYDAMSDEGFNGAYLLSSEDDGYTWESPVPVVVKDDAGLERVMNINETALLVGGRNTLIAAARVFTRNARLILLRTDSRGRLWTIPERYLGSGITGPSRHPGNLIRLRSGLILLTYGIREGEHGIGARVGFEDGTLWGPPVRVFSYGGNDNGYPSSLELDDGTILTAFYSDANRYHSRYHMGILRWKMPPDAAPRRTGG